MEVVVPLENDPILWGSSIQSFRHLELLNLSSIAYFRDIQGKSEEEEEQQQEKEEEERDEEEEERDQEEKQRDHEEEERDQEQAER